MSTMPPLNAEEASPRALNTSRTGLALVLVWGFVLAFWVCRNLLTIEEGQFFENHDGPGYLLRIMEFQDCLQNGYLFPQWCSNFRGGLGAPFFSFYQPGFFYVCSLISIWTSATTGLAIAVLAFTLAGYFGMFRLVSWRFGPLAGLVSATALLTSLYVWTNLYIRGDFSEYAAMMCVPFLLYGLLRFATESSWRAFFTGCVAATFVVTSHPAVALTTYGSLTVLLILSALFPGKNSKHFALRGLAVLITGVGLSAFYWLPLFLEIQHVSAARAWSGQAADGFYHFSNHFVPLTEFFDRKVTNTPIPVKLGFTHQVLTALAILVGVVKWRTWGTSQRRIIFFCGLLTAGCLFLMTPQSSRIWETAPLLERIQFPWRLLTLVSIGMAALCGAIIPANQKAPLRLALALGICSLLVMTTRSHTAPKGMKIPVLESAAEIREHYFAPDLADEWLPKDASRIPGNPVNLRPVTGASVSLTQYTLQQGHIRCDLEATDSSWIVIPHYRYPIGFEATLNDQPVSVGQNPQGLMRIEIPDGFRGELRIVWHTTAARWCGVAVSLATFLGACFTSLVIRRRSQHAEQLTK